jgi:hypothetical protein
MSTTDPRGLALVAEAGPGFGIALMRRFSANYEVVDIRRSATQAKSTRSHELDLRPAKEAF